MTLPDVDFIVATVSGAGIAGNVEAPIIGHMNAMTAQFKFRTFSAESLKLQEPREHNIDLRARRSRCTTRLQAFTRRSPSSTSSCLFRRRCRTAISPRLLPRTALAATPCARWVTYIDDAKVMELDPYNYICEVNGVDYLSDTRKALGKS